MELIPLFVLAALAVPILVIAGFVTAVRARGDVDRVSRRLAAMEQSLAAIETRLAALERPAPQAGAAPEPAPEAIAAPELAAEAEPARTEPEPSIGVPQPPASPPVATPPPIRPGLEEKFGTRWVVWVGGLALALGGIFLVRYSIEQGLVGPRARVFLGALLAAFLVGAGEWSRRRQSLPELLGFSISNIPSILTAAGTTVAYATIYAAYGLYGLLPAPAAFVLLGAVALATLAAALLHGPALAALGLLGADVTPLLVTSDVPNYWALYIYLAVVTAAAFALARARLWRWLALAAMAFGVLWLIPGVSDPAAAAAHVAGAVLGFALVAIWIVPGLLLGPDAAAGRIDGLGTGGLAAYLAAAAVIVVARHHAPWPLVAFASLCGASIAIAWRAEAATAVVPVAGALVAFVLAHWAVAMNPDTLLLPGGPAAGAVHEPEIFLLRPHLAFGVAFAALFAAAGFLAQGRSERPVAPILWASTAVIAPLAILIALDYRIAAFDRSIPFAGMALLIAALNGAASENLIGRAARPGLAATAAIFATGCVAALALALTLALDKGWLTIGLALMVPGIAWVADKRPLPALRFVAAAITALVLARIAWDPRIVGDEVGSRPIFNWLLYGYGAPAAAFALGGRLLRRRGDDVPARTVEAAAILFTVMLALFQIRHWMTGGDVYRVQTGLAEVALDSSVGLALAIGLERIRLRTRSIVHNAGAIVVATLSAFGIVFGAWTAENPFVTGDAVGGRFLNLILLGYAVPALLVSVLALVSRRTRPQGYRVTAVILAVGSALGYLTLEVSRLYQGPRLDIKAMSQAEQYTHSAAWLTFGVALLLAGISMRSQPVRLVSAAVIAITVAKVFLLDLASLEGAFRALSFIGLGLVLVGIGWIYQRLLFPPRAAPAPGADGASA